MTPLHDAVRAGDLAWVRATLATGVDVDARSPAGRTALHVAAEDGNVEAARLLLEAGFEVDARMAHGQTPLHRAAGRGFPVDLADSDGEARQSPAATAMRTSGHQRIVELLISYRAQVDAETESGETPLSLAAQFAEPEMVRLLISNGARVRDGGGARSLIHASTGLRRDVAELLLDAGAPVEGAIHRAADNGALDLVSLFLERGTPVDVGDESGDTPLICAVRGDHVDVAMLLLQRGAHPEASNRLGEQPLHHACAPMARELLSRGAVVNARASTGRTPLHEAAQRLDEETVGVLLGAGADVNAQSDGGDTPLHVIFDADEVFNEAHSLIALLVVRGADPHRANREGLTPMQRAEREGCGECAAAMQPPSISQAPTA